MAETNSKIQRVMEDLSGNEALLGMLETDAAREMLNWGISIARWILERTGDLDDFSANLAILPRLKAVRQSMRSIGNWAAGKYADPSSRVQLREKLLRHFRTIFGDEKELPTPEKVDEVLNQVDDRSNSPQQLILKLRALLDERP